MPFQQLHKAVNSEPWVTADKQVNMVGHDFQLNEFLSPAFDLLGKNRFEPVIY